MISIHASREGSDVATGIAILEGTEFQSTLPAREATSADIDFMQGLADISIHASREGSDPFIVQGLYSFAVFRSTLPAREATHV